MPAVKFKTYRELLTPEQTRKISSRAGRLYSTVYNQMEHLGNESITMHNARAIAGAKIEESELERAQSELVRAGFLDIEILNSLSAIYRFVVDEPQN